MLDRSITTSQASRPAGYSRVRAAALVALLAAVLGSCGGDGNTDSAAPVAVTPPTPPPAPPPPPPPSPPPPAFTRVLGSIFADPVAGAPLVVLGGGYQVETVSGVERPVRDVGPGTATYGGSGTGWVLDLPVIGRGSLVQLGAPFTGSSDIYTGVYSAGLSPTGSLANLADGSVDIFAPAAAGTAYRDVSWFNYYAFQTASAGNSNFVNGVTGLARPTPTGSIPAGGQRSYISTLVGVMSGNFADYVTAGGTLQADFNAGRLTGELDLALACFMGCSYPLQRYTFAGTSFDRTTGRFTGTLAGPSGRIGTYTAQLAGPGGSEILLSAEFDYLNADRAKVGKAQAVLIGRVG